MIFKVRMIDMQIDDLREIFEKLKIKMQLEIELETKDVIFLEDLIADLESEHLTERVKKYLFQKYRLQLTKYNYKFYLDALKTDLAVAKASLKITKEKNRKNTLIIQCLDYKQIISDDLIKYVIDTLKSLGINGPMLIAANERIKIHNTNVLIYRKVHFKYPQDKYLVINLLQQGYEDIPKLQNSHSYELDFIVNDYLLNGFSLDAAIADIQVNNPQFIDDCKYIYTEILRKIQDKIHDLIAMLKTEEFYFDNEILRKIKEEYVILHNKYITIRDLLDSIEPEYLGDDIDYLDDYPLEEPNFYNKLYYATNSTEPRKCYFLQDLMDIRKESIAKIYQMLENFKKGNNVNSKHINNGYIELKNDQIRIILKLLGHNNYSVEGVFIKKSDVVKNVYDNMFNRPIAMIDEEYAAEVEAICEEYVFANARKGTR